MTGLVRTSRGCTEDPADVRFRLGEAVPIRVRVDGVAQATVRVLYRWPAGGQERQIDGGTIPGGTDFQVSPVLVIPPEAPAGARQLSLQALHADQTFREIARCGFDVVGAQEPTMTPVPTPIGCAPLTRLPGLVAWWPMDEGGGEVVQDRIGQPVNNVGQLSDVPGTWGLGKVGGALHFNGSTTRVDVRDDASLDVGAGGDYSLDLWVRLPASAATSGVRVLLNKQTAAGSPGYQLYLRSGVPGLQLADASGWSNFEGGEAVPKDDRWHLVAVSVDRDSARGGQFFLDGRTSGPTFDPTGRPGSLENGSILRLGATSFQGTSPFDGWMDEVEVLRSALAAEDVALLFGSDTRGKCTPSPMPSPTRRATLPPPARSVRLAHSQRVERGTAAGSTAYGYGRSWEPEWTAVRE